MSNFEWFLLVGVVIVVPLLIAIVVTLWTLEMARQRKRSNRPVAAAMIGVKRNATKAVTNTEGTVDAAMSESPVSESQESSGNEDAASDSVDGPAESPNDIRQVADDPDVGGVRGSSSTS